MPTDLTNIPANLPVPEDDGAADHLRGTEMPALEFPGTADEKIRIDRFGPGRTVLYIYPRTGRPDTDLPEGWDEIPGARGCTPETCGFRDHHADLAEAGAPEVFGLSSQDTEYQREAADRLHLPFQLLSDPELRLAEALNLPTFETSGMKLYRRLTMIVRDGKVEHVFYPIFPPGEHAAQVLQWLKENPL